MKTISVYTRVSTHHQSTRSQRSDLERWITAYADGRPVEWFEDHFTGKTFQRPGWARLQESINRGVVGTVLIWRLDRLGRNASGLTGLFEDLIQRKIALVSVKDGFDLSTSTGRLLAHLLASISVYELELRGERVRAGQAAARAAGKRWGGSKAGRRLTVKPEQIQTIVRMKAEGAPVAGIARATGLSRPTVYGVLRHQTEAIEATY